jgi:hypothetical protein
MKSILSFVLLGLFSLSFAQIKYEVGEFNQLEAYDKLNVKLVQSDAQYIEVTGDKADKVEFVNKNKILKLRMNTKEFLKGETIRVTVYYKDLKAIFANEGSFITSDDTLDAENLLLNAKEGSFIVLDLEVEDLEIKTNTGAVIETSGNVDHQSVISNSGGRYDGEKLMGSTAEVTVNAGGEAKIHAMKKVDAKTRAGGNIHIFGGAEVSQKTIVGGTVHIH